MSSSELSELTSNVSSESEEAKPSVKKGTIEHFFNNAAKNVQPPKLKKKRPPSPPHEYVLADRDEVAFIVMFRSRFSDLLPKSLPHLGPQDIENGIVGPTPSEQVERLLCGILGLLLNRKKEVEKGHYFRALEDAISSHTTQWPAAWEGKNPLHGGGSFNNMSPEAKLVLMKALILWSLDSSDAVKATIKDSYKQSRHEDDLNQPLSVQAWGRDGDKRRFWLIEGQDDTHFRLYRESNPILKHVTWRSLAGSIEELQEIAEKLGEENTMASRRLRDRILASIPRFEAGEDKRRRRDYRLARKAQFTRPEPGLSLYEGRTRGKRIKYTYSDEEGATSDAVSTRRSNRQSGVSTPAEPAGPRFTASGRQIRSRHGGDYGETLTANHDAEHPHNASAMDVDDVDEEPITRGRSRRAASTNGLGNERPHEQFGVLGSSEDSDNESDETASSNAWNGGDDDEAADQEEDEDDEDLDMSEDDDDNERLHDSNQSLVVRLRYNKGQSRSPQISGQLENRDTRHDANPAPNSNTGLEPNIKDDIMTDAPPMPPVYQPQQSPLHQVNGLPASLLQPTPPSTQHANQQSPQATQQGSQRAFPSPPSAPPVEFNPHAFLYQGKDTAPTTSHGTQHQSQASGQAPDAVRPPNPNP